MPVRVRKYAGLRHLIVLLTACSLFLSGCGAKLPDSGTIPSVTVAKDTLFTLEISTEEVQKKGMRVDGLTAAIKEQFRTAGGVEAANGPGPGTLAVRVDVRDIYLAGMTRKNYLTTVGATAVALTVGAVLGTVVGAAHGLMNSACFCIAPSAIAGGVLGAATGATLGYVMSEDSREAKEIWAMRAGVGMAWHGRPDTLEEVVVSTGADGVSSRTDAVPALEKALAQRIREALMSTPASP